MQKKVEQLVKLDKFCKCQGIIATYFTIENNSESKSEMSSKNASKRKFKTKWEPRITPKQDSTEIKLDNRIMICSCMTKAE